MLSFIKDTFWDYLSKGNPSVLSQQNIQKLNEIAIIIYNKEQLEQDDIECLKYILMICNLLYNRTDMEVLPIEDGFYDLLLEKYKKYDSNFQVGSAVVDFRSSMSETGIVNDTKAAIYRLPARKEPDEVSQIMRDNIMRTGMRILNPCDYIKSPIVYMGDTISKRTHSTEHNHPDLIGTLDKCKFVTIQEAIDADVLDDPNVAILERDFFLKHIHDGIIYPDQVFTMSLELKYDGISVEADCTDRVISARTRGDTGVGKAADITPILGGYLFKHAHDNRNNKPIGIKFEAIMTRSSLYQFNIARGYNYSNCRTAIVGLFGAGDAYKFQKYITLIPLAVDRQDTPWIDSRESEIEYLNTFYKSNGEPLRHCFIQGNYVQCLFQIKKFLEEAEMAREYLDFMYDGIVVSYVDPSICAKLGRENFINKYQMAVKFDPLSKITTFRYYTYEVGQDGRITPMIHYDPVEFLGTIHPKSTGSSLKRFNDLALKKGDQILVTYRNDVMPYVTKPDCEYNRNNPNPYEVPPTKCPACNAELIISDSGKTMSCPNPFCIGRKKARITNMLAKLNLKGFGDSRIESIDVYSFRELINLSEDYLAPRIGEGNARNFVQLMTQLKSEPVYDYVIVGALGFSGIASLTWKKIFNAITIDRLIELYETDELYGLMSSIKSIGPKTIETITEEMDLFLEDLRYISNMSNVMYTIGSENSKLQIRFSGCRDKQLEEQLCNAGYDADSSLSVTKDTDILIIPYEGYTSTKTRHVSEKCRIIPISDFKENQQNYLS